MTPRLRDTRTHRVAPLEPREPGLVRMYVCGPTVYDRSHVGHGRSYVVYDALRRHLEASGLRVKHVQNFTDVEETVRIRAEAEGLAPLALAEREIGSFLSDMDRLLVRRAHVYPRVTEHIPQILRVVEDLVDRDIAYKVECDTDKCNVYFDVANAPDYGALVGAPLESISASGVDGVGERRHAADFALWKARDDWGVTWPSRWGDGRPGWHVECAAMSKTHLGVPFDIHGGGMDLVFPHHESERVIAEAAWGKEYCGVYLHNGFVTVEARKMSKSKGNFVYLHELLDRHGAEALRAWYLSERYRAPLPYSEARLQEATDRLLRWRAGAARVRSAPARPKEDRDLEEELRAALDDDLDTPRAGAALDAALADGRGTPGALAYAAEVLGLPSLALRI